MTMYSEFIRNISFSQLDSEVIVKSKVCLMDALGSILGGQRLRAVQIAQRFAEGVHGQTMATILGSGQKTVLQNAVFANGVAASALDIDDCQILCLGHPGAVVVPATISVAEAARAPGKAILEALVAGYEIATRYGSTQASPPGETLVYGSGRWGCLGAAASASKLLSLNLEEIDNALGISATFGPMAPLLDKPTIKPLPMTKESIGWGAMVGVSAAMLAREGFTGASFSLEEDEGKAGRLGEDFTIRRVTFKPYPSCRWTHSAIDAILDLKARHGREIVPENIEKISVYLFKKALHINHPSPPTVESAQYSIPFTIAAAITDGEVWLDQISEERIKDPLILSLAKKVEMIHKSEFDQAFPARPAEVEIETRSGKTFRKRVDFPKGDLENPMDQEQMEEKFLRLATNSISLKAAVKTLDRSGKQRPPGPVRREITSSLQSHGP
jgi:2-methylcitrate dehydratase PrpD